MSSLSRQHELLAIVALVALLALFLARHHFRHAHAPRSNRLGMIAGGHRRQSHRTGCALAPRSQSTSFNFYVKTRTGEIGFPRLNVADSGICIGVALIFWITWKAIARRSSRATRPRSEIAITACFPEKNPRSRTLAPWRTARCVSAEKIPRRLAHAFHRLIEQGYVKSTASLSNHALAPRRAKLWKLNGPKPDRPKARPKTFRSTLFRGLVPARLEQTRRDCRASCRRTDEHTLV